MSTIYSEEVKEVIVAKKRTVEGIKCDICKTELRPEFLENGAMKRPLKKYYNVKTGNNDWGNDSHESIKHRDICPDCIDAFVSNYLKNGKRTEYIEIETGYVYQYDKTVSEK